MDQQSKETEPRMTFAKRVYLSCRKSRAVKWILKTACRVLKGLFPRLGAKLDRLISDTKLSVNRDVVASGMKYITHENDWAGERPGEVEQLPLVSVVVPNYNHAPYLRQRLETVYNQTYPNFEVILLDDCSTDDSRQILAEYAGKYPEKTRLVFNEVNGGKVFKQWNKGISHARGSLIWIAESDDWCEPDFLEKMVPRFAYESVMLAFCRTVFMQDGEAVRTLEDYLSDVPQLDLSKPFMLSAHSAVRTAFALKNMIPNVSSAMFRNTGLIPAEITDIWQNIKLCGDWLFYLHTLRGGTLSYTNETTNYYRLHKSSTSLKIQKTPEYYREQEQISCYVARHYSPAPETFSRVQQDLQEHCLTLHGKKLLPLVQENYSPERIALAAKEKRLSVLICGYALKIGGGETYPIVLANEMKRQGVTVTFLNFDMDAYSAQVRRMLDPAIPLITLESQDQLGRVLQQVGADVIHTHHAYVDLMVSMWLGKLQLGCRQVVTLHGLYEMMDDEDCRRSFENLSHTCDKMIYIAEKNLTKLTALGFRDKFDLVKIGNGLPAMDVTPVDRHQLGIEGEDFVFCLVSRAIPEKGWQEAVDAVLAANRESRRKIHVILVGEGEMRKKLSTLESPYIHVVGQKANVRDYFAASDMGLLPSVYQGESFPLTVIECMLTGKPVLASDLGEIRYQLTDEEGDLAGMLIDVKDWKIDTQKLAGMMVSAANDEALYSTLRGRVESAGKKFDITRIVKQHLELYEEQE